MTFDDLSSFLNQLHDDYDNGRMAPLEPKQSESEEEATVTGNVEYKIGDEIADEHGNIYIAMQDSYYISQSESDDTEEGFDVSLPVGWHTPARLRSQVTQMVVEQVQAGLAKLSWRDNAWQVLFHDEKRYIPLSDLAYSSEIGLYQKSKFPDLKEK